MSGISGDAGNFYQAEQRQLIRFVAPLIKSAVQGSASDAAAIKLAQQYGLAQDTIIEDDPGPFHYVWNWFLDLHRRRGFDGAAGVSLPIQWSEISAWSSVTGTLLAVHEAALITEMDDIFLKEERAAVKRRQSQQQKKGRAHG